MSFYFDKTLDTKLKELTEQLSDLQNLKENQAIKNLDNNYQSELIKEQKQKKREQIEKKKREKIKNREVNFFEIPLRQIYVNFINTFSNIFSELISLSYENDDDLESDDNIIYKIIYFYIKKISFIFFQEDRLVYVGLAFILSSFFVYFILVSK